MFQVPSTIYRHNLKESNKKRYDEYLALQRERSKNYRHKVKADPEKLREQKEKAKLRQRKFRENQKKKVANTAEKHKENPKPRTRGETCQKRQQWRASKRKYREKLSAHKKVWISRKDKERKARKKNLQSNQGTPSPDQTKGYRSKKTLYNTTSNARKSLPKSPEKYASVMKQLVNNTTPRKRKAFQDLLESCDVKKQRIDVEFNVVKEKTNEDSRKQKTEHQGTENKTTCTTKNIVTRIKQQYQFNKPTPKTTILVKRFYVRGDVSTPLPQKRYANKHGPGYVMQRTLLAAYRLFKSEHKSVKIGFTKFTKFTKLRPKNVRLLTHQHWVYCVCTVCQNITYKLKALTRCVPGTAKDIDELLNVIMCQKSDAQRFHNADCIFQKCDSCKNTKISELFSVHIKKDNAMSVKILHVFFK